MGAVDRLDQEIRIGQAVSEGIADPLLRAGHRLKKAVSDVNVLCIIHIVRRRMKLLRGWVILQRFRKCIRKMPAGVHIPRQDVRRGQSAFHAALKRKQGALNPVICPEPLRLHHAADVQDYDHLRKVLRNQADHLLLRLRQAEIAVLKKLCREVKHLLLLCRQLIVPGQHRLSVPAFAGKTADGDDRGIREGFCLLQQFGGNLRFHRHARSRSTLILPGNILLIEVSQGFQDLNLSFLLFDLHTLMQAAQIRHRHIAAPSAAFHVVSCPLSEQRNLCPLFQRKHMVFIFQKNHSLARHLAGQFQMFSGRRNPAPVLAQWQDRSIPKPVPMAVHRISPSHFLPDFRRGGRNACYAFLPVMLCELYCNTNRRRENTPPEPERSLPGNTAAILSEVFRQSESGGTDQTAPPPGIRDRCRIGARFPASTRTAVITNKKVYGCHIE